MLRFPPATSHNLGRGCIYVRLTKHTMMRPSAFSERCLTCAEDAVWAGRARLRHDAPNGSLRCFCSAQYHEERKRLENACAPCRGSQSGIRKRPHRSPARAARHSSRISHLDTCMPRRYGFFVANCQVKPPGQRLLDFVRRFSSVFFLVLNGGAKMCPGVDCSHDFAVRWRHAWSCSCSHDQRPSGAEEACSNDKY